MSDQLGSVSLEVAANVESAISNIIRLRQVTGKAFAEIANAIEKADREMEKAFQLDTPLKSLKLLTGTLSGLDAQIGAMASKTKGIDLSAPFREALNVLQDLRNEIAAGLGEPTGTLKEQQALQSSLFLLQTQQAHEAAVAKEQAYARQVAAARKAVGEERALQEALFRLQTEEAHQAALAKERAYAAAVKAAETAALKERQAQEKLGAELSASINRLFPQLARDRQRQFDEQVAAASGLDVSKLDKGIRATTPGLDQFIAKMQASGGAAGGLGKALGAVTGLFARFGLTARDVGIALGAGFLTTGPAIVLLLGVALVGAVSKAIFALASLGSELLQLRQVTERAVGGARQVISDFAQNAAADLGITEAATLRFVNRTARLLQSFGTISKEASATIGAGFVEVAEILRVTSGTGLSMDNALDRIFNTISGNIEGLRDFNIFMTEISLKQLAAAKGIELTSETLDAQERSLLASIAAYDAAIKAVDDFNSANATIDQRVEGVKAQIGTLVAQIGQHLAPAFLTALEAVKGFLEGLDSFIKSPAARAFGAVLGFAIRLLGRFLFSFRAARVVLGAFFRGMGNVIEAVKNFIDEQPLLQKALDAIVTVFRKLQPVFDAAVRVLGFLTGEEEKNTKSSERNRASKERLRKEQEKLIEAYRAQNRAEGRSAEGLQKLIDLEEKAAEARREATKSIEDATIALARSREDAARDVENANRDLDSAIRDQAEKNADALAAVKEAEEDAEQAIFDARERLGEAKIKRDRAIRDAEEKLAKARLESARKVDDAERQLADARRRRNEEIVDAQLSLDEALARGDANAERNARLQLSRAQNSKAVVEAERDLREAEVERIEKIKEAERDLKETRLDSNDAVADAQRQLDRVIEESQEKLDAAFEKLRRTRRESAEAVEEAQRRLHDIEIANNRAIFDAQRRLNEAQIEGKQRIEETQNEVDELRRKYELTTQSVAELLDMLERVLNAQKAIGEFKGFGGSGVATGGASGHFAHGGHMKAGQAGWVGERGIELFIPDRSGTVVSNAQLIKVLQQMSRGSSGRGNSFTVVEAVSAEATARAIEARLAQQANN